MACKDGAGAQASARSLTTSTGNAPFRTSIHKGLPLRPWCKSGVGPGPNPTALALTSSWVVAVRLRGFIVVMLRSRPCRGSREGGKTRSRARPKPNSALRHFA